MMLKLFPTPILTRLMTKTCDIQRSGGSATGYTTPVDVHTSLRCSNVQEIGDEERERAGLASISRPCRIYVKLPSSGVIQQHDVLITNSKEYAVIKAKLMPHDRPAYYELILDYER